MPQSNELRVFISSTFRDLQEEREHLVKKIFPEIRALCRERGVTFTEIDLRWGITEEEAERDGIIRTCLEEIDRCRPYFIGILGERYGWTPPLSEAEHVAVRFPVLADATMRGASITEMEIVHGVLANPAMARHAYFYFREPNATPSEFIDSDEDAIVRLKDLKDRIRQSNVPVRENFPTTAELGQWLQSDLRRVLDNEYPASEAPSPLEIERRSHMAFAASRHRGYIPNPLHLNEFNNWLAEGATPLVVVAESGMGKSALAAYLSRSFGTDHPSAVVIEHYVGASEQSGSALSLARHLMEEIREQLAIAEEPPTDPKRLLAECGAWLWRLEHLAAGQDRKVLVVIDALNQLDEEGRRLAWLPSMLPPNVKLLVTTTPGDALEMLDARQWRRMRLEPIEDEQLRRSIVVRYLGEFHKGITTDQIRRVTLDPKGASPLYLRVVTEELRLHGEHETLDEVITRYTDAVDLLEVFENVLERMERDHGRGLVRELLTRIWASRSGLSESEVLELTEASRLDLSRMLFVLDYHLLHRDGLLGFFHQYLRDAVENRYVKDEAARKELHRELAGYFEEQAPSARISRELCWQLYRAGEHERLARVLATVPHFLALYQGDTRYEVLGYWAEIGDRVEIEESYRPALESHDARGNEQQPTVHDHIVNLLESLGHWNAVETISRKRLDEAIERKDRLEVAEARFDLGRILSFRNDPDASMEQLRQSHELFRALDHRNGLSKTIGSIGVVHTQRGEYDLALECWREWEALCIELDDRNGLAGATINLGNILATRGNLEEGLEYYHRGAAICRELGNRNWLKNAVINIGIVYSMRGEHERALECFHEQEAICRELGDRKGVSQALGSSGRAYAAHGDYEQALECFREQEAISRELGDRTGGPDAICQIGRVYAALAEHDRALECFRTALAEYRIIGERAEYARTLVDAGRALVDLVVADGTMPSYLSEYVPDATDLTWRDMALHRAREHADECVAVSDEIARPDILHQGNILRVHLDLIENRTADLSQRLRAMLQDADNDAERADVYYWSWRVGRENASADPEAVGSPPSDRIIPSLQQETEAHRVEALRLYRLLLETTARHDYRRRIEELSTTDRPEATDAA